MRLDESLESPPRETAGQFLRQKREAFGYELSDVADRLRIRYVYLVAIEEDRLDDLPGATYAVGFVRAYAELLELDGPAIVNRFKEETAELAKEARLVFPSPRSEGRVPSGTILLLSIVAAALVYGGWVYLSSKDRPIAELVPALPERFLALIGKSEPVAPDSMAPVLPVPMSSEGPAEPSGLTPSPPAMPSVTAAPVGPVTRESVENPSTAAAPAPAEPQAAVTAQAPAQAEPAPARVDLTALPAPPAPPRIDSTTPREYGEENTDARVVLRAAAEVWVQVRDSGGNLLLTRLLRAGDSYRVPNDPGLVMRTGNAGGLDIVVDGNAIPRIGSAGAVMKEVKLDADLLKAGTATRQ